MDPDPVCHLCNGTQSSCRARSGVKSLPGLGANEHFLGAQAGWVSQPLSPVASSPWSSELGCTSRCRHLRVGERRTHLLEMSQLCVCVGGVVPLWPSLRWRACGGRCAVRGAGWLRPACPGSGLTPLPGPLSLPGFLRLDGSEVTSGFLFLCGAGRPNWKDMSG